MEKEGEGGHLVAVSGSTVLETAGAASAANGDVPAKGEKLNQRVFSDTEGAQKRNGEREAGQEKGDLISDQHPPGAQRSH